MSWRKPVTFGLSFGITTATLGWLAGYLEQSRLLAVTVWTIAITSAVEVFLVAMQQWRGVPSHFNDATAFDNAVFGLMGLTISLTGVAILLMMLKAFRDVAADASMKLAVRTSLFLLLVGQFFGAAMIGNGLAKDVAPQETNLALFGAAGVMKVPHGVAMHAIQVLPILALLLTLTSLTEERRTKIVAAALGGYAGLVAVAALQTFTGMAPFDLGVVAALLAMASLILLIAAFGRLLLGLRTAWS